MSNFPLIPFVGWSVGLSQYPKRAGSSTSMLHSICWCCCQGLFSAANIFSSLKLVYIFSVNPYLGPLQVLLASYRVFIKYFVFPKKVVIFLNSAIYAAALVFDLPLCTHTDNEGKPEKPESGIYFKIFEKTQYLINNLYLSIHLSVFLSIYLLSIRISIDLSEYLNINISIYLSIYISTY